MRFQLSVFKSMFPYENAFFHGCTKQPWYGVDSLGMHLLMNLKRHVGKSLSNSYRVCYEYKLIKPDDYLESLLTTLQANSI